LSKVRPSKSRSVDRCSVEVEMRENRVGIVESIGVVLFALGLLLPSARGELVVFAEGGAAQLPAEFDGEVVRLIGPEGPVEFLRDDFHTIVPGHWPEADWPDLRDRALAGDASRRYSAAWWALEHGLIDEAVAMLRSANESDPGLQPVAQLIELLDRLDRPAASPDLASLRKVLPGGSFSVVENDRLVLLHQHDEAEAAGRLDLLDRVLTAFFLSFAAQGFPLQVPPEKLVAVWFAEESDYLDYIRKEVGESFLTTRGYYHPTRRVVFFINPRNRGEDRRLEAARKARLLELDRAEASLSSVPAGARFRFGISGERPRILDRASASRLVSRLRRDTQREELLRLLDRSHAGSAAAVHEVVHQLVIASGLAPGYDRFPVWLHEGIAMQFEAFRGGRWAGLGSIPAHRLDQWRALPYPPPIEPILRDEGFGSGYVVDRYASAWALVWFLRTEQPERFVAFLDRLRNPIGEPSLEPGDRVLSAFWASFGPDLDGLRSDWITGLGALRSPLEAEAGAGSSGPSRQR
jgi:hypothetical protein